MEFLHKLLDITRKQDFYISLLLLNTPYLFFILPNLSWDNVNLPYVLGCIGRVIAPTYIIAICLFHPKECWRKGTLFLSTILCAIDILSLLLIHQPFYLSFLPSLLDTNPQETKEFLESHLAFSWQGLLMLIVCLPMLRKSVRQKIFSLYARFYDTDYKSVVILTVIFAASYLYGISAHLLTSRMPVGNSILRVSLDAYQVSISTIFAPKKVVPSVVSYDDSIPYVVVVLGESANKHHMSLYGYPLETTPWAEEEEQSGHLSVYTNTLATKHYTIAAMKDIFSEMKKDEEAPFRSFPNIFDFLRQTSYKTTWISNQENVGTIGSFEKDLSSCADRSIFTRSAVGNMDSDLVYDDIICQTLDSVLKEEEDVPNNFLVLHLMGSHMHAKNRYPADFAKFTPEDEDGDSEEVKKTRAEYDNSILYTDDVLRHIVQRFQEKDAIIIYLSDHGEDVYDEEKKFFAGHSTQGKDEELYIPFFVWGSDAFQKNHPDIWDSIVKKQGDLFFTDAFPEFLWDILSLRAE